VLNVQTRFLKKEPSDRDDVSKIVHTVLFVHENVHLQPCLFLLYVYSLPNAHHIPDNREPILPEPSCPIVSEPFFVLRLHLDMSVDGNVPNTAITHIHLECERLYPYQTGLHKRHYQHLLLYYDNFYHTAYKVNQHIIVQQTHQKKSSN